MATPDAVPARLGRYELLARLATGGMGEIFLARLEGPAKFEKLYVIKRILPHLADDVRFRGMLIAEARIASVMSHANICQVYELGETDGQLYIVMEYLEGITMLPLLHRMSKEARALELGFVVGVIQQAIDGLHFAHELKDRGGEYLGIVHRDVTPSNIFLTDAGIVKILDFGIAKVKDASAHTQTGTVKGKYAYMAPEQLRGGGIDRRADVFALGIVMYEMLALRRLFQRKTDYLTFRAVMEQPIPDIRHYRADCPTPLAEVVMRALDRDRERRFSTARQLGSAVLDVISRVGRPWSQGEIGDYVVANFTDTVRHRGAQIASLVHSRTAPSTIPVVLASDEYDIETADEFPPVDSVVAERPPAAPAPGEESTLVERPSGRLRLDPLAIATTTPFGSGVVLYQGQDPSSAPLPVSAPLLPSAPRSPAGLPPSLPAPSPLPPLQVVPLPPPRRHGMSWPVVVIALIAVATAAAALFVVWRSPSQPTIVFNPGPGASVRGSGSNIEVGPEVASDPLPTTAPPVDGGPARKVTSLPPKNTPTKKTSPIKPTTPTTSSLQTLDEAVVKTKLAGVTECMRQHGVPPRGTRLELFVGSDGRPTRVAVVPAELDATKLGQCLKAIFHGAVFSSGEERPVIVNINKENAPG